MSASSVVLLLVLLNSCAVTPLSVTLSTESVVQPAGSTVWVDCITSPKDNVQINWDKDGIIPLLPASGKEPGDIYVLSNDTLKIVNLKRRQAGTYKCIATLKDTTVLKKVVVTLSYIQKMGPIEDVGAFVGDPATISCVPPLGKPSPKLLWLKDGKTFSAAHIDQSDWKLTISSAKLEDTGKYTCVAMGVKNRTADVQLTVHKIGQLVAKPARADIVETESVKFVCESTVDPPLSLKWKNSTQVCDKGSCKIAEKDVKSVTGRIILENGTLEIMNVGVNDEATYNCIQSLGSQFLSTEVQLNVIEKVKVQFRDKEIRKEVYRDKLAKIECRFTGDNVQKIEWSKADGGKLPPHMRVENSTLVINGPTLNDTGDYNCTVTGPHNTASETVKIQVFIAVKFTTRPMNITVEEGKSLWVHCRGSGSPKPEIFYLRDKANGGNLSQSHYIRFANGSMNIKNVKREDVGSVGYMCWLKNEYSSVYATFWITLTVKEKEAKGSSSMHRTIGIAVGCAGLYIILVIGLMIYCRARRARLLKGIITEVDGEGNVKDPLVGKEAIPMDGVDSLEKWEVDRGSVEEIETLGHGKMGRVFKAYCIGINSEEKRTLSAVKEFKSGDKDHKDEFNLEVEMLAQLKHGNVVQLLGVSTNVSPWYLITNYGEEGDMKQYLKSNKDLDTSQRLQMCLCIVNGMDYLVKQGYIHRDLAARNCVVKSNKDVMISFFSLCEDVYQEDYYNIHGIPVPLRWLSPEAIESEAYSEKSDVWSFGVTVWEVFASGEQPYSGHNDEHVHKNILADLRLSIPSGCPQSVFEILEKCWVSDADKRPTFSELASMFADVEAN